MRVKVEKDLLDIAIDAGQWALAAQLMLDGFQYARHRAELLKEGGEKLLLPRGHFLAARARAELGVEVEERDVKDACYGLVLLKAPGPCRSEGAVVGVKDTTCGENLVADTQFIQAVRNGKKAALSALARTVGSPYSGDVTIGFTHPMDLDRFAGADVSFEGESIGLAVAVALMKHLVPRVPVAATGSVDPDGRVKKVRGVREKIRGLLREMGGEVRLLFLPAENRPEVEADEQLCAELERAGIRCRWLSSVDELCSQLGLKQRAEEGFLYVSPETVQERLQDALELRVGSMEERYGAGKVRLAAVVKLPPGCARRLEEGGIPPGWEPIDTESAGHEVDFFSKITWTDELEAAARPVLYSLEPEGAFLPAVFRLRKEITGGLRCPGGKRSVPARVQRIDLVPFRSKDGPRALVGFVLAVEPVDLRSYLEWISLRNFGRVKLEGQGRGPVKMEGMVSALMAGLDQWQEPRLDGGGANPAAALRGWNVVQCLVLPWAGGVLEKALESEEYTVALKLLGGLVKPRDVDAAKVASTRVRLWRHDAAVDTVFLQSTHGFTAACGARDDFNRGVKPFLVTAAYGLLYLLAGQLGAWARGREFLRALSMESCNREELRRQLLGWLCEGLAAF